MVDIKSRNIIIMGLASMCLMVIFQILISILVLVEELKFQQNSFSVIGYRCLTVIYATILITVLLAPFVIYFIGPKMAILIGSASYMLFILCIIHPISIIIYMAAVIYGMGSALIWTGQGIYLVKNSSESTISKHCILFWIMLQLSVFWGSAVVYLRFLDVEYIDSGVHMSVIWVLLGLSVTSLVLISVLPDCNEGYSLFKSNHKKRNLLKLLYEITTLIRRKLMLLLCIPIFFLGFYSIFFIMGYGIAVGHATLLERPKQLCHFVGIFIALGEISGGCSLMVSSIYIDRSHRTIKVTIGFMMLIIALFMVFINLPNEAIFFDTDDSSLLEPSAAVIIISSFLLGVADTCFNTQIIETVAWKYRHVSAIVFPVFKLIQTVGVLVGILYTTFISLYGVLAILVGLSIASLICFIISENLGADENKILFQFRSEEPFPPKFEETTNMDSKKYSPDAPEDNTPETSTPSASSVSSLSEDSFEGQPSEHTQTKSPPNTPPRHPRFPRKAAEEQSNFVKDTNREPKVTCSKSPMSFFRNIFRSSNEIPSNVKESGISVQSATDATSNSSSQTEAVPSSSGDKPSRSLSTSSISPSISRPTTQHSNTHSAAVSRGLKVPPISKSQQNPSFLKKLISFALGRPRIVSEESLITDQSITPTRSSIPSQTEAMPSSSGNESKSSISPSRSRPKTSYHISQSAASPSESRPSPTSPERIGSLNKFLSMPQERPWLDSEGLKDGPPKKYPRSSRPVNQRVRVQSAPTSVSLRNDSPDFRPVRRKGYPQNNPSKGILRSTKVEMTPSPEDTETPWMKTSPRRK